MKPSPRERAEAREERVLATYAAHSANHRGREQDEPEAAAPPTAETPGEIGPDAGSTAADDV